jgi:hypothetical protein
LYLTRNEAALTLCQTAFGAARPDFRRTPDPLPQSTECDVLRMQLAGASLKTEPVGEEQLPGTVNYFVGNDPARWHTSIRTYAKVRYPGIYPGIDLVYYGNQRQREFDFVVAPHADPNAIRLRFSGPDRLRLAANGDLILSTASGSLTFRKPSIYQAVDGRRVPSTGQFALLAKNTVGFRLGSYDRTKALVIDPVLTFSTFLGGSGGDTASAVAVDSSGNVFVAGSTSSTNFPVTPGSFQTVNHAAANQATAFVTKLDPTGTALVYSTYLGGSGGDTATGINVDSAGNLYVTGQTGSTDFPVTPGVFQATNKGAASGGANAFVTELNPAGRALVYSTYLGGSTGDMANAISLDAAGNAYVAGWTRSTDFPVTPGAYQTTNHAAASGSANAFVSKLNSAGTALVYSTYLGGSGGNALGIRGDVAYAVAVDAAGDAYVGGQAGSADFPATPGASQTTNKAAANQGTNAFVSKLNLSGTALIYSTYLGGSDGDTGYAIAVDAAGDAYVAGGAASTDFPVTQGAFQTTNRNTLNTTNAFVTKLNATGTALVYSTYLGGSGGSVHFSPTLGQAGGDQVSGLAIDGSGNVYVTGETASHDFPVTQDAYQSTNNDQTGCAGGCIGGYNAFVTELNSTGAALVYSTYLGGNGINPYDTVGVIWFGSGDVASALALDSSGNVYVAGSACSFDFPLTGGAFQTTIPSRGSPFVAKLKMSETSTATAPTVTVTPASSTITSGRPLMVTVSVAGPSGSATPTGTVVLASGTYFSSPATLSSGGATIEIPGGSLYGDTGPACGYPFSPDILSVNYLPDAASSATYKFSSALASVEVLAPCFSTNPDVATITWAQSQSQPFPLGISAAVVTGNPVPTGTVTITTGSYSSAATALSGGSANISIPPGTFTMGNNLVNVSYSGDSNYAPIPYATSALVTVTNTSGGGFAITGTAVTVKAGATTGNTSTITVTPTNGFTGSVALTAAVTSGPSGAQDPPTFSFGSTSPVNITGPTAGTATLTITTTGAVLCTQAQQTHGGVPWYTGGGTVLACILLCGIPVGRRSRRTALGMLALLVAFTVALPACGGSGGGSTCNGGTAGTTPGTYTITVTGTSGSTTATGTVALTVQ